VIGTSAVSPVAQMKLSTSGTVSWLLWQRVHFYPALFNIMKHLLSCSDAQRSLQQLQQRPMPFEFHNSEQ
jgi:hypothetical protein